MQGLCHHGGRGAKLCGLCEAGVPLPSAELSMENTGAVDACFTRAQRVSDCNCPLLWHITSVVTCSSLSSLPVLVRSMPCTPLGGVYMLFLLLYYFPHFISFFRPIPTSSRKPSWVSLHLQTIKVFHTCFSILVAHQLQHRPSALTSDGLLVQIPAVCVQGVQPPSGQVQADTRLGSECCLPQQALEGPPGLWMHWLGASSSWL